MMLHFEQTDKMLRRPLWPQDFEEVPQSRLQRSHRSSSSSGNLAVVSRHEDASRTIAPPPSSP